MIRHGRVASSACAALWAAALVFTAVPAQAGRCYLDGTGYRPLLWRNYATGDDSWWTITSYSQQAYTFVSFQAVPDLSWKLVGCGDFNHDGGGDLLWRHAGNGANSVWTSTGLFSGTFTPQWIDSVPDLNWQVGGVGDFDGDGKVDIAWRHAVWGEDYVWFMNGLTALSSVSIGRVADLNWEMAGAADLNGDGRDDILWRNRATGDNSVWLMNGASSSPQTITSMPTTWRVAGVADYDANGSPDIIWQRTSDRRLFIWLMNGLAPVSWHYLDTIPSDANWQPAGPR